MIDNADDESYVEKIIVPSVPSAYAKIYTPTSSPSREVGPMHLPLSA